MEMFLNTANPIMIIAYTLITALVIFISKKAEKTVPIVIFIILVIGLLIYHSITLDGLAQFETEMINQLYHCIAVDLILLLLSFISYLWVDDIVAKKKKIKSYDDSLSWFWNKI